MGQNTPSRQNHPNAGHFYSNIAKPVKLDLQFVVTPTNGLGITSLKSNGYVNNVFMHTSTTPATNNGFTNPNPAVGYALIQLRNNFNAFLGSSVTFTSTSATATKIDNAALTIGNPYVISTLGNASLATWQGVGLPVGVTPAVGVAFIATAVGGSGNTLTSRVMVPSISTIDAVEMFGNPILTANSNIMANSGEYLIAQFLASTSSSVTTLIATAPAVGTTVNMSLFFDASSVTVDGL